MQQQGEEPCESPENSHPESQGDVSSEVVPEATASEEKGENYEKDSMLETPTVTSVDEIDVDNGINDNVSSDPPSTRTKTSRSSKKRHNKPDKSDVDSTENAMKEESRHDNGLSETNIAADASTPTDVTNDVEDDVQDIIVDEQDETITLEASDELNLPEYTVEFPVEDGKNEDLQVVIEEEISITTSVSCEEVDESKGKSLEIPENCSLAVSSSELHQFSPIFDREENISEHAYNSDNLSVSASSWGGNIRSISARKPMRNSSHFVMRGRSSVSTERPGTDGNYCDTDCSVDTTEGSIFSSQKRKACDIDTTNSKKQKVNDSKNSKFFSMVSSPLRMLKNKLSDRIVENLNAPCTQDIANGNNENEEDEKVTTDKIKKEGNEIKEKSLCVVSNEVSDQNSMYRSWCSLM